MAKASSFHTFALRTSALAVSVWLAVCGPAHAFNPLAGDYSKDDPHDIRVMAYNHHGEFISNPSSDAEFNRILVAIDPDVICFEEFDGSISANTIASRLNSVLPIGGSGWQIHLGLLEGPRNVLASRYPLLLKRTDTVPASSTRGVTIALVDLPDAVYTVDVYLLGVHLKCCGDPGGSEDASRQDSADALANWLGDARGVIRPSGNYIALAQDTPMMALGDFNLVGGPQPENTILTGNIQDNGVYGPDVKGDWDNSNLTNLMPADPFTGDTFTWQGSQSFPPSALDRMFFTDSALLIVNSFVFNTNTMTPAARAALGVQAGDTLPANTSDHLPIVADLRLTLVGGCTSSAECDDGDPCNGTEICVAQMCTNGVPPDCADGNPCTNDVCVPLVGCQHANNMNTCDDGDECTLNDACAGGGCSGTPRVCDDGDFCNGAETCDAFTGCQPAASPCGGSAWCDEVDDVCVDLGDGDLDEDSDVDLHDFALFQGCFGQPAGAACAAGNIVGDDAMIDAADADAFVNLLAGS